MNDLEQAPQTLTETIEAAPVLPAPETNNNLRDAGVVVGVVVAAALFYKLYLATSKK
jgi:hypothetical protein|tara:strand:- start:375 stop:545 length:171 start_codon:yes stop_codon:yes gene_type:complete